MIETCGKQHADLSDKQSSKYAGVSIALMNDLIDNYKVSLCFLLENHANVQKPKSIIKRMKFNAHHVIASNGQSRRLWYMWNSDVWQIKRIGGLVTVLVLIFFLYFENFPVLEDFRLLKWIG